MGAGLACTTIVLWSKLHSMVYYYIMNKRLLRSCVLLDWYLNTEHHKVIGGASIFGKARDRVYPSHRRSVASPSIFRHCEILGD